MSHWKPFFEKIKNELDARLTHSAVVVVKTSDANLIRYLTSQKVPSIFEHTSERPGWVGIIEHAAHSLDATDVDVYLSHVWADHRIMRVHELAKSIPDEPKTCYFRASSDTNVLEQSAIFSQLVPQVKLIFFIANSKLDLAVDPVNFGEDYFVALGSYLGTSSGNAASPSDFTEVVKRAILLGAGCSTVEGDRALGALGAIPPNPKPEISFSLLDQAIESLYTTSDRRHAVFLENEELQKRLKNGPASEVNSEENLNSASAKKYRQERAELDESEKAKLDKREEELSDEAENLFAKASTIQSFFIAFIADWNSDSTPKNDVSQFESIIEEIERNNDAIKNAGPMPTLASLSASRVKELLDNSRALRDPWRNHVITTLIKCFQPELVDWARRYRLEDDFYFACARVSRLGETADSAPWYAAALMPEKLKAALQQPDLRAWLRKFKDCWNISSPMMLMKPNALLDRISKELSNQLGKESDLFEGRQALGRILQSDLDQTANAFLLGLKSKETGTLAEIRSQLLGIKALIPFVRFRSQMQQTEKQRFEAEPTLLSEFNRLKEKGALWENGRKGALAGMVTAQAALSKETALQLETYGRDWEAIQRDIQLFNDCYKQLTSSKSNEAGEDENKLNNENQKSERGEKGKDREEVAEENKNKEPVTQTAVPSCLDHWPLLMQKLETLNKRLKQMHETNDASLMNYEHLVNGFVSASIEPPFSTKTNVALKRQKQMQPFLAFLEEESEGSAKVAIGAICASMFDEKNLSNPKGWTWTANDSESVGEELKAVRKAITTLSANSFRLHSPDIESVRLEVLIAQKQFESASNMDIKDENGSETPIKVDAAQAVAAEDKAPLIAERTPSEAAKDPTNSDTRVTLGQAEENASINSVADLIQLLPRLLDELEESQKREPLIPKERVELLRAEYEEAGYNLEGAIVIYERLRDASDPLLDPVLWRLSHYGALRCRMSARSLPEKAGYASLMCFADVQDLRSVQLDSYGRGGKRLVFPSFRGSVRKGVQALCRDIRAAKGPDAGLSLFIDFEHSEESDFDPVIYDRLMRADVVIIFLSYDYFTSPWCRTELSVALQQNRFRGTKLYYVAVDTVGDTNTGSIKDFLRSRFLGQVFNVANDDDQFFVKDRLERLFKYGLPLEPSRVSSANLAKELLPHVQRICAEKSHL